MKKYLILVFPIVLATQGCSTLNLGLYAVSLLQSPITYRQSRNDPSESHPHRRIEFTDIETKKTISYPKLIEDYEDLEDRTKVLAIALSGGGARATYFSSAVLRDLEEWYSPMSLTQEISFFSSVSGGSTTNALIGTWYRVEKTDCPSFGSGYGFSSVYSSIECNEVSNLHGFAWVHDVLLGKKIDYQCGNLSNIATGMILSPFNMGIPLMFTLFTNQGYGRYLAFAEETCLTNSLEDLKAFHLRNFDEALNHLFAMPLFISTKYSAYKLADLGNDDTRFFINSTILETGQRFVFANKKYHDTSNYSKHEGLNKVVFLEDLNSSIDEFSVSDSVIASMSFPAVTDPLILSIFSGSQSGERPPNVQGTLRVADGGIYDNSGISTLVDVIFDAVKKKDIKKLKFTILFIDSDNETLTSFQNITKETDEDEGQWKVGLNLPIKAVGDAVESALLIHDMNKRRVLNLMLRDIQESLAEINKEGREIKIQIIPIALSTLVDDEIFSDLNEIPTDFSITENAITLLEKASKGTLNSSYKHVLQIFLERYSLDKHPELVQLFPDANQYKGKNLIDVIKKEIPTDYIEARVAKKKIEIEASWKRFDCENITKESEPPKFITKDEMLFSIYYGNFSNCLGLQETLEKIRNFTNKDRTKNGVKVTPEGYMKLIRPHSAFYH